MRWFFSSLLAIPFLCAATVRAEESSSINLRSYHTPLAREALLNIESASDQAGLLTGVVRMNYAFQPVVLREDSNSGSVRYGIVEHQLVGELGLGIGLAHWLTAGVELPAVLAQGGDDYRDDPQAVALIGGETLPLTALSDPALSLKFTYYHLQAPRTQVAVATKHRISLPLGDERSLDADGTSTLENTLLLDVGVGSRGRLSQPRPLALHLNAGHLYRFEESAYACGRSLADCPGRLRHSLSVGTGAGISMSRLIGVPLVPFVETRMLLRVAPVFDGALFSAAGAKYMVGDVTLMAGAEWSYIATPGAAPIRATVGLSYTPGSQDSDGDGKDDSVDHCPDLRQGPHRQADDGCPESPTVACGDLETEPRPTSAGAGAP